MTIENLAIDISEFINSNIIDLYSFEKLLEKIEDLKIVEPSFIKKVLMVLISNV